MNLDTTAMQGAVSQLAETIAAFDVQTIASSDLENGGLDLRLGLPGLEPEWLSAIDLQEVEKAVESIEAFPERLANDVSELGGQILALESVITSFAEISEDYENLEDEFSGDTDRVATALEDASEKVVSVLPGILGSISDELVNRLEVEVKDVGNALMKDVEAAIQDTFAEVEDLTGSAAEILNRTASDLAEEFRGQIAEVVKGQIEGGAEDFVSESVEASLSEIADGMAVSQISAQVTSAMSAQLPQLIAAKHTVGAVRKLLELMRAGF